MLWFLLDLYDSECIFNNPWFEEPTFECSWCENVKDIERLNDTQDQELIGDFMRQARPVIFKVHFFSATYNHSDIILEQQMHLSTSNYTYFVRSINE